MKRNVNRHVERAPRRVPERRTSQQIVDAVVEAATELLAERGVARLTTNEIAERAGVSIGSLYRYFPDKETIVAEIDLRSRRHAGQRFIASMATFETDPVAALRQAVESFVLRNDTSPAVRRALMRDVPIAWVESNVAKVYEEAFDAAAAALCKIRTDLSHEQAKRRVFVAIHAVQGVTTGSFLWQGEALSAEVTTDEICRLITGYLLA